MTDKLRETVSALADGEVQEFELRRLLDNSDGELRRQWADLHRQRDALHGELDERFADWDISVQVSAAIAEEGRPAASRWSGWRSPLQGIAVAASVAAVVVFGARGIDGLTPQAQLASSTASVSRLYPSSGQAEVGSVTANADLDSRVPLFSTSDAISERERFEYYLQRHTERAALNNGQGMMSYARVVGHEVQQ